MHALDEAKSMAERICTSHFDPSVRYLDSFRMNTSSRVVYALDRHIEIIDNKIEMQWCPVPIICSSHRLTRNGKRVWCPL